VGRRGAAGIFACACAWTHRLHMDIERQGLADPTPSPSWPYAEQLPCFLTTLTTADFLAAVTQRPALQRRIFRRRPRIAACNNPRRHPSYWLRWPVIAVAGSLASPPGPAKTFSLPSCPFSIFYPGTSTTPVKRTAGLCSRPSSVFHHPSLIACAPAIARPATSRRPSRAGDRAEQLICPVATSRNSSRQLRLLPVRATTRSPPSGRIDSTSEKWPAHDLPQRSPHPRRECCPKSGIRCLRPRERPNVCCASSVLGRC
jgi:hypothetical protein